MSKNNGTPRSRFRRRQGEKSRDPRLYSTNTAAGMTAATGPFVSTPSAIPTQASSIPWRAMTTANRAVPAAGTRCASKKPASATVM